MTNTPLIQLENVSKYFRLSRHETLKAVDDVTMHIHRGETLGLVGESGCGKSTLGRVVVRLYEPSSGRIKYDGVDIFSNTTKKEQTFNQKVQMIFQNPYSSLNPRMTVRDIVGEGLKLHHDMSGKQREDKIIELLSLVGLQRDHLSRFPHEFSGGQRQRIGIARALSVDPEFIVCDEPISALDVSVQAQVINMLKRLQASIGLTYLFIAHDLSVVRYISDRVHVMYLGKIVETAKTEELFINPRHPYTKALLSAIPKPDPHVARSEKRIAIKGEVMSPINPKPCCRFSDRCPLAEAICFEQEPIMREIEQAHCAACHLL